jgi:hypothetical protein
MPNYIYWTKHGESGVIMEEDKEEEQLDPDDILAQYCDFLDTAMGEAEEEAGVEHALAEDDDALGDVIHDAQRDCESDKEKAKFDHMLEDHKKLLYPSAKDGQKKLGTTLELLQWKARNGISNKAFGQLLMINKKMLLRANELFATMYEAKQVVYPLGLEIQKINGNTFYTVSQDKRSTNQNSGVSLDAIDPNGNKHTYYGRIEDI